MKKYFVFLVFIFLPITIFADVICNVTYNTTPVCGAEGDLQGKKMTYRTVLLDGDSTGAYNDLTLTESKVIGLGSTFTEAWNDAHDVCERAGCIVHTCDLATEETISSTRIEVATIDRNKSSLAFKCFCSYGVGGKWKEGNNSCGGFVDTKGQDELKNSVALGFHGNSSTETSGPIKFISLDDIVGLSPLLDQVQEICDTSLKNMENVSSNAVAFIHSCWFVWAR